MDNAEMSEFFKKTMHMLTGAVITMRQFRSDIATHLGGSLAVEILHGVPRVKLDACRGIAQKFGHKVQTFVDVYVRASSTFRLSDVTHSSGNVDNVYSMLQGITTRKRARPQIINDDDNNDDADDHDGDDDGDDNDDDGDDDDEIYEVASITKVRCSSDGQLELLVMWQGYGPEEATWEPLSNLQCATHLSNGCYLTTAMTTVTITMTTVMMTMKSMR